MREARGTERGKIIGIRGLKKRESERESEIKILRVKEIESEIET